MDASYLDTVIDVLIDELAPVRPPGGDADRRLVDLVDSPRPGLDEQPVLTMLTAAVTVRNLMDHLLAQAVTAAERLGIPARRHLRSAADLLMSLGMSPGAAYRAARVGRAAPTLAALTRQQRLGAVGIEYADAVGKGIAHISTRVELPDHDRAQMERTLMIQTTPSAVHTKARAIAIALAKTTAEPPPGGVPVAENTDLNEMTLHHNDDGRIHATLDLDALTGEELFVALDPLCRPIPLPDGSPDPRPARQRRADAFGQLIRTYLSHSNRPTSGGVLPHVTLIRTVAASSVPDEHVDTLGFTGPISTTTADLISCDCTATTVLVDTNNAPLDVGRSERLFPPHIRKALAVRDQGCAFPGCGKPASWCDAHHLTEWSAGGVTSIDNAVLLCRRHHTLIHHGGWQAYLGSDRHPWFIPPHHNTGPQPHHLRSHARRTLTTLPTAA